MMADGSEPHIKQEIDTSCCSPSPSTNNSSQSFIYAAPTLELDYNSVTNHQHASPDSPDRQFCSSTTTPIGDMCIDSNIHDSKDDIPKRLCLVCGDTASGFHYGVASCEACKAFFKRTIQGNIEYTCPANNECEINKRRRKACQACRFQKCLLMGMLKEGVRLDRVRGGRQKYRRNPAANTYQLQIPQSASSIVPQSLDDIKMLEVLSSCEPDPITISHCLNDMLSVGSCNESNNMVMSDKVVMSPEGRIALDPQEMLNMLSDIYDRELVCVIGWAKQIPGFTDLPLNDQMKLLQVSWAELLTLQLAHRSIPFRGKLFFATDVWLDERSARDCGATELFNHCVFITQRLERLSTRKEEYYLLKALALSNSDIRLDNLSALRKFRDSILSALNDCLYLLRQLSAVSHQQQLMLLLPSLRQADHIVRKFWIGVHRAGTITMNKLFIEMLEPVSR